MHTLTTPLLRKSFACHKIIVSTVESGSRGIRVRLSDDKCYAIELVAVYPVQSDVQGVDVSLQVSDMETGIYQDGKSFYQISLRRL